MTPRWLETRGWVLVKLRRVQECERSIVHALGSKLHSWTIVRGRPIFYFLFFKFLMGSVLDIYNFYQYITTFNLINITIKNIAINTGRLWRRLVLGQPEMVCTVNILDVQGDTAINLCRERSLVRRRVLAFRRGALSRAARALIVERTSVEPV